MAKVRFSAEADAQLHELPRIILYRMSAVVDRLEKWPAVSGAKPLRHALQGTFRIRTGDYRIIFRPDGDTVVILRIEHRKDVYEE